MSSTTHRRQRRTALGLGALACLVALIPAPSLGADPSGVPSAVPAVSSALPAVSSAPPAVSSAPPAVSSAPPVLPPDSFYAAGGPVGAGPAGEILGRIELQAPEGVRKWAVIYR